MGFGSEGGENKQDLHVQFNMWVWHLSGVNGLRTVCSSTHAQ